MLKLVVRCGGADKYTNTNSNDKTNNDNDDNDNSNDNDNHNIDISCVYSCLQPLYLLRDSSQSIWFTVRIVSSWELLSDTRCCECIGACTVCGIVCGVWSQTSVPKGFLSSVN